MKPSLNAHGRQNRRGRSSSGRRLSSSNAGSRMSGGENNNYAESNGFAKTHGSDRSNANGNAQIYNHFTLRVLLQRVCREKSNHLLRVFFRNLAHCRHGEELCRETLNFLNLRHPITGFAQDGWGAAMRTVLITEGRQMQFQPDSRIVIKHGAFSVAMLTYLLLSVFIRQRSWLHGVTT